MLRKEIKISFLPCSAFSSSQAGILGIYSNSSQLAKALQAPSCNKRLPVQGEAKEHRTLTSPKLCSNKPQHTLTRLFMGLCGKSAPLSQLSPHPQTAQIASLSFHLASAYPSPECSPPRTPHSQQLIFLHPRLQ